MTEQDRITPHIVHRIAYLIMMTCIFLLISFDFIWPNYLGYNVYIIIALFYIFLLFPESICGVSIRYDFRLPQRQTVQQVVQSIPNINKGIYLLQREDGIFKVGRTIDLKRRLKDLSRDYGQSFEVIYIWDACNLARAENKALEATKHLEFIEGNRQELRRGKKDALKSLIDGVL